MAWHAGQQHAAVLFDKRQWYERILTRRAGEGLRASEVPSHDRARLALSQYAAERGMCAAGALSGCVKPHKGLVAGCQFAADILQTFFAESIEGLASSTVQVRMYVDDNHIRSTVQGPALVGNIVAAADFWRDEVARLGVWLLTLTSRLNLSMDCKHSALRVVKQAVDLGVDFALGAARGGRRKEGQNQGPHHPPPQDDQDQGWQRSQGTACDRHRLRCRDLV